MRIGYGKNSHDVFCFVIAVKLSALPLRLSNGLFCYLHDLNIVIFLRVCRILLTKRKPNDHTRYCASCRESAAVAALNYHAVMFSLRSSECSKIGILHSYIIGIMNPSRKIELTPLLRTKMF